MEASVRAFEDWEFRVLEQESGIDEEDESTADGEKEGERAGEMEKEISRQQHAINAAQVNNNSESWEEFFSENFTAAPDVLYGFAAYLRVMCFLSVFPPPQADGGLTFTRTPLRYRLVTSDLFIEQVDKITGTIKSNTVTLQRHLLM